MIHRVPSVSSVTLEQAQWTSAGVRDPPERSGGGVDAQDAAVLHPDQQVPAVGVDDDVLGRAADQREQPGFRERCSRRDARGGGQGPSGGTQRRLRLFSG